MSLIATLITDFGLEDAYVGILKGVILSINPEVTIIDICHTIQPQNIPQAAFVLETAFRYFPIGTIHLVIVDPEVGTDRKAIILNTGQALFVAPDNGVLSNVFCDNSEIVAVSNPRFWLDPVSSTFHGRDLFAPVAAHLSLGVPIAEFGEPISSPVIIPVPQPQHDLNGRLIGHIIHIDHFGNLITSIRARDLPRKEILIKVGTYRIEGLSSSYAEGNDILALIESSGRLEIAMRNGSAARRLKSGVGDRIIVTGKA